MHRPLLVPGPLCSAAVLALVLCSACSSSNQPSSLARPTALNDYLRVHRYTPFDLPRDNWGTGTLIRFEDGTERIVATRSQCFALAPSAEDSSRVAMTNVSYDLSRSDSLELNIGKLLGDQVEVRNVFGAGQVGRVRITLADPFRVVIPEMSIRRHIAALGASNANDCLEALTHRDHYLISEIIGVKGVQYEFFDRSNSRVNVNADLIGRMGLTGQSRAVTEGRSTLNVDGTMYLAYRIYRVGTRGGYLATDIVLDSIPPAQVMQIKAASAAR